MKNIVRLLASALFLIIGANAGATNFFVVGSFSEQEHAATIARQLQSDLGVDVIQRSAEVDGTSYSRLLIESQFYDEAVSAKVNAMGIKPWRISLTETEYQSSVQVGVLPSLINNNQASFDPNAANVSAKTSVPTHLILLVGVFSEIDDALRLERALSNQALPVMGKAELKSGSIVHEVWVGPGHINDLGILRDAKSIQLSGQTLDILKFEEVEASVMSLSPPQSGKASIDQQNKGQEDLEQAPKRRYPKDYNLARLPPKKES